MMGRPILLRKRKAMLAREKEFIEKVNAMGKYEYISGYVDLIGYVVVRHIACGNEITLTAGGVIAKVKSETCIACRPTVKPKTLESPIQGYCRCECKALIDTLCEDGYLFDEELVDFVTHNVRGFLRVSDETYNAEECINICLEHVYDYYNRCFIGVCRCCDMIKRGRSDNAWSRNKALFSKRICKKCNDKMINIKGDTHE